MLGGKRVLCAAMLWGGMTAAAHGQAVAGDVVTYEPDYFAVFSPRRMWARSTKR